MKNNTMSDLYVTHTSPYDDIDLVLKLFKNPKKPGTKKSQKKGNNTSILLDAILYTLSMISLGIIIGLSF